MQWIEAKVVFRGENEQLIVDLIADAFYSLNAKGVVVDDPRMEPGESWAPDAVPLPEQPAVTGYLPADAQLEHRRQLLAQRLVRLAEENGFTYGIHFRAIDEEDWAQSWKAFFWPRRITPRIVVKPTWREYRAEPGQLIIEIDPGMAFGTGTHPTTVLCIHLLEKYLRPAQRVLDVGTGSGILLIAAAKLGAARLTGIDLDPLAVEVARQNIRQNHIPPEAVELICGHLVDHVTGSYDVVVANILAEVIIHLLDDVTRVIRPGGLLICSGIIQAARSDVAEKMTACGFDVIDVQEQEEWVALAGRLGPAAA
jgi:ribosomal protein L11 methyltransferase